MTWTAVIIVIIVLALLGLFEEGDMADRTDEELIDELNNRHS